MPPKTKKVVQKSVPYRKLYKDVLQEDVSANPMVLYNWGTDNTGSLSKRIFLTSQGYEALELDGQHVLQPIEIAQPHLKWLYEQSTMFYEFRILTATLVFVSSQGSQAPGSLRVFSTTCVDSQAFQDSGPSVYTCSLSRTAEFRAPLTIDSSWKVCSDKTMTTGNNGRRLIPFFNLRQLGFSIFRVTVTGGAPNSNVGTFNVLLDAEFRYPKV
jgi:hypothetical protein